MMMIMLMRMRKLLFEIHGNYQNKIGREGIPHTQAVFYPTAERNQTLSISLLMYFLHFPTAPCSLLLTEKQEKLYSSSQTYHKKRKTSKRMFCAIAMRESLLPPTRVFTNKEKIDTETQVIREIFLCLHTAQQNTRTKSIRVKL